MIKYTVCVCKNNCRSCLVLAKLFKVKADIVAGEMAVLGTGGKLFVLLACNYSLYSDSRMPFTEPPPCFPYLEFPGVAWCSSEHHPICCSNSLPAVWVLLSCSKLFRIRLEKLICVEQLMCVSTGWLDITFPSVFSLG